MNLGSSSSSNTRYNSNSNSNNNNNNNRRSQLRISMQDDVVDERKEIVDSNKQMDVNEGSSVAATATATTVATATTTTTNANIHSKLRTLKDRMWVREALEDLTAAEFACSLAAPSSNTATTISNNEKKKKSTLDYENILSKLENRIDDMCVINQATDDENTNANNNNCIYVSYPENYGDNICDDNDETKNGQNTCYSLKKNSGMGRVTYTDEQRISLLTRILASRQNLIQIMTGSQPIEITGDLDKIREELQTPDAAFVVEDEKTVSNINSSSNKTLPDLYVRDDGTIDWDGALQDREAVKKFGIAVWARINGQEVDDFSDVTDDDNSIADGNDNNNDGTTTKKKTSINDSHGEKKVRVKIIETEEIREKKTRLDILEKELTEMEITRTALLNSAVYKGSTVANVELARLDPKLRSEIRTSDDEVRRKKDEVAFQTLNYEMERIYTYLDGELGNTGYTGYIPLQDRLNVAEFGLLESQLAAMNNQIATGESIDADVLSVMLDQTVDFKRRLGIDYYVTGLTFDIEAIKMYSNELLEQCQTGLAFYMKGLQLLWNDVVFMISLIGRALQGYTLKPREVRNVRRTFKDITNFIPFVIILIAPISPIGHVMVFGAIQRFFPEFFPTAFTERRQNLLSLYEATEYSEITIEENWQEQLVRLTQAWWFLVVDNTKKTLGQVKTTTSGDDNDSDEEEIKINGEENNRNSARIK